MQRMMQEMRFPPELPRNALAVLLTVGAVGVASAQVTLRGQEFYSQQPCSLFVYDQADTSHIVNLQGKSDTNGHYIVDANLSHGQNARVRIKKDGAMISEIDDMQITTDDEIVPTMHGSIPPKANISAQTVFPLNGNDLMNFVLFSDDSISLAQILHQSTPGDTFELHVLSKVQNPDSIRAEVFVEAADIDEYCFFDVPSAGWIRNPSRKFGNLISLNTGGQETSDVHSTINPGNHSPVIKPNDVAAESVSATSVRAGRPVPVSGEVENKRWFRSLSRFVWSVFDSSGTSVLSDTTHADTLSAFENRRHDDSLLGLQEGRYKVVLEVSANNDQDSTNNRDSAFVTIRSAGIPEGWDQQDSQDTPRGTLAHLLIRECAGEPFELFDADGERVFEGKVGNDGVIQCGREVTGVAPGVYFVRISGQNLKRTYKLTVPRK